MSDRLHQHHALESFLRQQAPTGMQSGVHVRVQPDYDHINLRGSPEDTLFRAAVEATLSQPLPVMPNTWSGGAHTIYWLGPDEWLIVAENGSSVADRLDTRLGGRFAAVNAQSGGLLQMALTGEYARVLLARGCTLDLHPKVFPVGTCAQTGLAKAGVLLALMDETPSFNLIVRRSFAEYIAMWLNHAGGEFGVDFVLDK